VIRGFKIGVTKWLRQNATIDTVWERNDNEQIMRSDDTLARIRA